MTGPSMNYTIEIAGDPEQMVAEDIRDLIQSHYNVEAKIIPTIATPRPVHLRLAFDEGQP